MEYYKKFTKLNMLEKIKEQEKEIDKYKNANIELLQWLQEITSDPYSNNAYSRVLDKVLEIMKKYE